MTALVACARRRALRAAWLVLQRRLELVARADHELRGPLTALLMAAERGLPPGAELARVRLGLEDLAAARERPPRGRARAEPVDLFDVDAGRGARAAPPSTGAPAARSCGPIRGGCRRRSATWWPTRPSTAAGRSSCAGAAPARACESRWSTAGRASPAGRGAVAPAG